MIQESQVFPDPLQIGTDLLVHIIIKAVPVGIDHDCQGAKPVSLELPDRFRHAQVQPIDPPLHLFLGMLGPRRHR